MWDKKLSQVWTYVMAMVIVDILNNPHEWLTSTMNNKGNFGYEQANLNINILWF